MNKCSVLFLPFLLVSLLSLTGCSSISDEDSKILSNTNLYVLFNNEYNNPSPKQRGLAAGYVASTTMYSDLSQKLSESNQINLKFIENKSGYVPGSKNYLLIVNFEYYHATFFKTIRCNYALYHFDNIISKNEFNERAVGWRETLFKINDSIVSQSINAMIKENYAPKDK